MRTSKDSTVTEQEEERWDLLKQTHPFWARLRLKVKMSASSKEKATTFQFASEDLEKKLDREYVLSHSHQENFFADNMNLVCGNGFNSKISASRQPLCSYSHPSIFCPSGDKLELFHKKNIAKVEQHI